jgi:hypothetical protein
MVHCSTGTIEHAFKNELYELKRDDKGVKSINEEGYDDGMAYNEVYHGERQGRVNTYEEISSAQYHYVT